MAGHSHTIALPSAVASAGVSMPQPAITKARWAAHDPMGDSRVVTAVIDVELPGLLTLRSVRVRRAVDGRYFAFAARCRFSDELEQMIVSAARAAMREIGNE